jgi:hypothetical protein
MLCVCPLCAVIQKSEEQKPIVTIKEVAKVANVSHDTIAKVKKIEAVAHRSKSIHAR